MKRLLPLLAWAFVLIVAASALAQTGDGYVGIYRDSLATQACVSVSPVHGRDSLRDRKNLWRVGEWHHGR
jgi:hypothetical protein